LQLCLHHIDTSLRVVWTQQIFKRSHANTAAKGGWSSLCPWQAQRALDLRCCGISGAPQGVVIPMTAAAANMPCSCYQASAPSLTAAPAGKDVCHVAVLGASGYTGAEVVRLSALHPNLKITALTGDRQAGKVIAAVCVCHGNSICRLSTRRAHSIGSPRIAALPKEWALPLFVPMIKHSTLQQCL